MCKYILYFFVLTLIVGGDATGDSNIGVTVGAAAGGVLVAIAIIGIAVFIYVRKRYFFFRFFKF